MGLVGEPVPGPADAGLHLVQHEQRALGGRDGAGRLEVARRRDDHAEFALDGFEDDEGRVLGDGRVQRLGVTERHVGDVPGQRQERLPLAGLPGEGEGAHGAAVEGALGRDDVGTPGEPADLEGGLVGLGAGVAEEDPAVPAEELEQPLGEGDGRLGEEEVGDVAEEEICRVTASTIAGWPWPRALVAMPPTKSRYSLPSASQSRCPSPRTRGRRGVP